MLSNTRIDAIGRKLRKGQIDADCLTELEKFRAMFVPTYRFVEDVLANKMGLHVTGRPSKSTVAILDKLNRESVRLSQMQDIAGCRVLVEDLFAQDKLVADMQIFFGDISIDDKRERPSNGYRAVHVIFRREGRPVEIQIRTMPQHAWAEISEKFADRFGHEIKYGKGDKSAIGFLMNLASILEKMDVIRERRRINSELKKTQGKNKKLFLAAKKISAEERMLLREINALFSGRKFDLELV